MVRWTWKPLAFCVARNVVWPCYSPFSLIRVLLFRCRVGVKVRVRARENERNFKTPTIQRWSRWRQRRFNDVCHAIPFEWSIGALVIEPQCYTLKCQDLELGFDSRRFSCRLERFCPETWDGNSYQDLDDFNRSFSFNRSNDASSRSNKSVSGPNRHDETSVDTFIPIKRILREKIAHSM